MPLSHLDALAGGSGRSCVGGAGAFSVEELARVVDVVVLPSECGGPREVAPEAEFVGGVDVAGIQHMAKGFDACGARAAALREAEAGQPRGTVCAHRFQGSLSLSPGIISNYDMA